jgi:hypothetical protein
MPDLQIKPLEGIGEVNFGMPVGVVRHILGEPEKSVIDIQEDRGNLTPNRLIYSRKWAYPSLGVVLSFTAPNELAFDLRLRSITIDGSDATLDGVRLLGLTEKEFLKAIAGTQIGTVELISKLQPVEWADPDCEIREYACERVRMTFWIENGIVTSISMWDEIRTTPYIKFKTTVKMAVPDFEE